MEYLFEEYTWTSPRKVLTDKELIVPGLDLFGTERPPRNMHILPPHIHRTAEFLYLNNGAQKYYIEDREYLLTGNHVLVVNPDTVHSTGTTPYGRYESLWFQLDIPVFAQSLGLPEALSDLICQRLTKLSDPLIAMKENRFPQLREAFYQLASPSLPEKLRGWTQFTDFITYLVKCTDPVALCSPEIQNVLSCIRERVCTKLTLEELAETCGLSLSAFKQKFRRETGISPREYINIQKIEKAKELLSEGCSVTETAFALDFSSSSYFSVVFRQMEDIAPSDWQAHRLSSNT